MYIISQIYSQSVICLIGQIYLFISHMSNIDQQYLSVSYVYNWSAISVYYSSVKLVWAISVSVISITSQRYRYKYISQLSNGSCFGPASCLHITCLLASTICISAIWSKNQRYLSIGHLCISQRYIGHLSFIYWSMFSIYRSFVYWFNCLKISHLSLVQLICLSVVSSTKILIFPMQNVYTTIVIYKFCRRNIKIFAENNKTKFFIRGLVAAEHFWKLRWDCRGPLCYNLFERATVL